MDPIDGPERRATGAAAVAPGLVIVPGVPAGENDYEMRVILWEEGRRMGGGGRAHKILHITCYHHQVRRSRLAAAYRQQALLRCRLKQTKEKPVAVRVFEATKTE